MPSTMKRPLFSYTTEDFAVLEAGLPMPFRERVLCICSGGETMLNLLAFGARHITVVDNSFPQLALARLKYEGMRRLRQEQFHALLGLPSRADVSGAFAAIREALPQADQKYWQKSGYLRGGALWCGSLSRYFGIARCLLRLAIGRKRLERLAHINDASSAEAFVEEIFGLWRFRLLLAVLLHPRILGRYYPEYGWKFLAPPNTPKSFCIAKLKTLVSARCLSENPVVFPYLYGDFPESLWPPYFRTTIPSHILGEEQRVVFVESDLREMPFAAPVTRFNGFALCNVMDWIPFEAMRDLMTHLRLVAAPGARLLMYSRALKVEDARVLDGISWTLDDQLSNQLTCADRTGYHRGVFLFTAT